MLAMIKGGTTMKIGIRKVSPKRMVKARTTARVKRAVKSKTIPTYGKFGLIKHPKKAIYNKIYRKTSFSIFDLFK